VGSRERIWQELHELFEADDGSLPEFAVSALSPAALVAAYNRLVEGARVVSSAPFVHRRADGRDLPLQTTTEPASGVARGELEPFHIVLGGIRVLAVTLPDIGVGVFPDEIILDYRMGAEWAPETVEGFLHLLAELARTSPSARVGLEQGVPRFWVERFERAWIEAELGRGAT
jgi:hypothetical protein